MKYSEKKITKAVTEIYEKVLSPQEIRANELIERFNAFMKEINDSIGGCINYFDRAHSL